MASSRYSVDVSSWTNGKDSDSNQKRSDIIHQMLQRQCLEQLRTILESGWDVNEELIGYDPHVPLLHAIIHSKNYVKLLEIVQLVLEHGADPNVAHKVNIERRGDPKWVQRTVLQVAVSRGWTELVKMLLDAGAKCKTSDGLENPLVLALQRYDCPTNLLSLLLKHGADPNDHDKLTTNIPLLKAIKNCSKHSRKHDDGDKMTNVKLLLDHGANPNVAHSVNIGGCEEATWVERTALDEAATLGLVDVVKMLLDAGAKYTMLLQNQMGMILNTGCHPDLIELMLKQGTDPNHYEKGEVNPLLCAITSIRNRSHLFKIVQLLLEYGANPHVAQSIRMTEDEVKYIHTTPLHAAASRGLTDVVKILLDAGAKCVTPDTEIIGIYVDVRPDLIELLLERGADLHYVESIYGVAVPLLHRLTHFTFYSQHLDLIFLHGGNINREDGQHTTVLESAIHGCGNNVRWLIRHGADTTTIQFNLFFEHCIPDQLFYRCREIPLILLQAGMRVSHGALTQLSNMEMAIRAKLQKDTEDGENIEDNVHFDETMEDMWAQLQRAEEERPPRVQCNLKKSTFPEYFPQQMFDLQEFSDESLQVYPDETIRDSQGCKHILDMIQKILEFLRQPQSLQWYCRRCVRENLVSLQPSVVKTLNVPAALKRYILCHGI